MVEKPLALEEAKVVLKRRWDDFRLPPKKTVFGDTEENYRLSEEEDRALTRVKSELDKFTG